MDTQATAAADPADAGTPAAAVTEAVTAAAPPAGDQISLTQLARGLALNKRQAAKSPPVAAPTADDQEPVTQDAGTPEPVAADQSPPTPEGADPNALWNQTAEETGTEGTEGTQGTDDAEDPVAEPEGEAEPADANQPSGIRKLQKRVDKLTASLRQTQEALQKANELIAAKPAEEPMTAPNPNQPFAGHPEVVKVDKEIKTMTQYLTWCREHEEGGEFQEGEKTVEFDADQVRRIRENVELRRTELAAERATVIAQLRQQDGIARQQCEGIYRQAYGDLERGTSPEAQEFQRTAAQAPWIKQYPNWKLWIGDAIRGRMAREAALKKAAAGNGHQPAAKSRAAATEPAPVATRPVAAAAPVEPGKRQLRSAAERYSRSRSVEDLARVIAAERAAARAR